MESSLFSDFHDRSPIFARGTTGAGEAPLPEGGVDSSLADPSFLDTPAPGGGRMLRELDAMLAESPSLGAEPRTAQVRRGGRDGTFS